MSDEHEIPTVEAIRAACEANDVQISGALDRLVDPLSDEQDSGGWSVRQLLSHLIGAMYRVPIHAAFFKPTTEGESLPIIPIEPHSPYWLSEWATAPIAAFRTALNVTYQGNLDFLANLDPETLALVGTTPFGDAALGDILLTSYAGHPQHFHGPQLEAFLPAAS